MDVFLQIMGILGVLVRLLGFLVFGYTVAWFVLTTLRPGEKPWQLVAVIVPVFLLFVVVVVIRTAAGGAGAFALGLAGGFYWFGMRTPKAKDEEEKKAEE